MIFYNQIYCQKLPTLQKSNIKNFTSSSCLYYSDKSYLIAYLDIHIDLNRNTISNQSKILIEILIESLSIRFAILQICPTVRYPNLISVVGRCPTPANSATCCSRGKGKMPVKCSGWGWCHIHTVVSLPSQFGSYVIMLGSTLALT